VRHHVVAPRPRRVARRRSVGARRFSPCRSAASFSRTLKSDSSQRGVVLARSEVRLVAVRTTPCRSANNPSSQCEQDLVAVRTRPRRNANNTVSQCEQDLVALRRTRRRNATNTAPQCDKQRVALRRTVRHAATSRESVAASRTSHCDELGFNVREPRIALRRAVLPPARDENQRAPGERRIATNSVSRRAGREKLRRPFGSRSVTPRIARMRAWSFGARMYGS